MSSDGSRVLALRTLGRPGTVFETVLIGVTVIAALYLGSQLFIPLATAVLLAFVLTPLVQGLRRVRVPRAVAVVAVVLVALGTVTALGAMITRQVAELSDALPRYEYTLREKIRALRGVTGSSTAMDRAGATLRELRNEFQKAEPAAKDGREAASLPAQQGAGDETRRPIPVEVHSPPPQPLEQVLKIVGILLEPLATTGIVVLFLVFILLQREDVRDRAIRLLGTGDLQRSTAALDDAGSRLSKYFLALTLLNAGFGIFIALGLWIIGVPSPILWGILAMLMRFVPFIGTFIAAALPLVLAAAVDPGWTTLAATFALFAISEPLMGHVVEPVVQGQTTGLSPLAIVISAAFWTLLWGPVGLLLAVPLTLVLVVFGKHIKQLEFLNVLLGDEPALTPAESFYQRMLASDPDEAADQAEQLVKQQSLTEYYDAVALEGLHMAHADYESGRLPAERLPDLQAAVAALIDNLSDHPLMPLKKPDSGEDGEEKAAQGKEIGTLVPVAPDALLARWQTAAPVLCIGARNDLDNASAQILAHLLQRYGLGARVIAAKDVRKLSTEDARGASLVCICAFSDSERHSHTRFLVRRLRRVVPDAAVLGCFWKSDLRDVASGVVPDTGVDASVSSIEDALEFGIEAATVKPSETLSAKAAATGNAA